MFSDPGKKGNPFLGLDHFSGAAAKKKSRKKRLGATEPLEKLTEPPSVGWVSLPGPRRFQRARLRAGHLQGMRSGSSDAGNERFDQRNLTMTRVRQPVIECPFYCLNQSETLIKCKMSPKYPSKQVKETKGNQRSGFEQVDSRKRHI